MTRGLLWLPLLVLFLWLAWAGWNESQKVEAYGIWAQQFEQAKYDIYSVLGQTGAQLTWGKPTRKGPSNLATFSLKQVQSIHLQVNDLPVDPEAPPQKGRAALKFQFIDTTSLQIPFTEIPLAARWAKHLIGCLQSLRTEKSV